MAYTPKTWIDRNVADPLDYVATKGGGGALSSGDTLTMTASPGVVTAAGTPITATDMNNIELGVEAVTDATWFLLDSDTLSSSVATFDITVPSGYDKHKVVFSGLSSVGSVKLHYRLNAYSTAVYDYMRIVYTGTVQVVSGQTEFDAVTQLIFDTTDPGTLEIIIDNPDTIFDGLKVYSEYMRKNQGGAQIVKGSMDVDEVLDTVTIFPASGNIVSGAIWKLYGLKT